MCKYNTTNTIQNPYMRMNHPFNFRAASKKKTQQNQMDIWTSQSVEWNEEKVAWTTRWTTEIDCGSVAARVVIVKNASNSSSLEMYHATHSILSFVIHAELWIFMLSTFIFAWNADSVWTDREGTGKKRENTRADMTDRKKRVDCVEKNRARHYMCRWKWQWPNMPFKRYRNESRL